MRFDGDQFMLLDQTLLPHEEKWVNITDSARLINCIERLAIRGAPAIGIASALLLALLAERGLGPNQLAGEAQLLRRSRPTAINLMYCIDRIVAATKSSNYPAAVITEAERIFDEDIALCKSMAQLGAELINKNEKILTHCNTGALATAGSGTAMAVIDCAHRQGKNIFVWVDETRPLLQGGRLTAWECLQLGIPHSIICDNAAASLMAKGEIDRIFVGSDRIAANGDFANKIGTYSLAVLAHHHKIPFYVVAPYTTIDPFCPSGTHIPVEIRNEDEVRGARGGFGSCTWSPSESPAYNPAFDITPAHLVSGWIIDTGVFTPDDLTQEEWWKKG